MPKLSLYRENFTNDYKWFDRRISEQFTVGCATVLIHKYVGPINQGTSNDATQPDYLNQSVNNISTCHRESWWSDAIETGQLHSCRVNCWNVTCIHRSGGRPQKVERIV